MSQPDDRPEDRTERAVPDQEAAARKADEVEDDVKGHAYTGALQDKNQQP